jgi:hypothetical protein
MWAAATKMRSLSLLQQFRGRVYPLIGRIFCWKFAIVEVRTSSDCFFILFEARCLTLNARGSIRNAGTPPALIARKPLFII